MEHNLSLLVLIAGTVLLVLTGILALIVKVSCTKDEVFDFFFGLRMQAREFRPAVIGIAIGLFLALLLSAVFQ